MSDIIKTIRAEIEHLKKEGNITLQDAVKTNDIESGFVCGGIISTCDKLITFLDTLEVKYKDVDLEKEIWKAEEKYGDIDEMGGYHILLFDDEFRTLLRHFFSLGLNSKK